jgi:diaminopimelate epimerase
MISFKKMHGLGNDFVILDGRKAALALSDSQVRHIADRHRGVGCDQLIVMEAPETAESDIFMRIYNPDGSVAGACGNATRCVADILMREKGADKVVIQTISGLLVCTRSGVADVTVDMGPARLDWDQIPLSKDCDTLHLPLAGDPVGVNMGNPHAVLFVADADKADVAGIGPGIEKDPLFPQKTNVEFVSIMGKDHLRMRVWERGAGITQACGSGACAVGVAAVRRGLTGRKVKITLDGGDLLIEWRETDGHVLMTGPLTYSFDGNIGYL